MGAALEPHLLASLDAAAAPSWREANKAPQRSQLAGALQYELTIYVIKECGSPLVAPRTLFPFTTGLQLAVRNNTGSCDFRRPVRDDHLCDVNGGTVGKPLHKPIADVFVVLVTRAGRHKIGVRWVFIVGSHDIASDALTYGTAKRSNLGVPHSMEPNA